MEFFFTILVLIATIGLGVSAFYYRDVHFVAILAILACAAIHLGPYFQALFFLPLALTFHKGLTFNKFAACAMFSSIVLAYLFLQLFATPRTEVILLALFTVVLICSLGILGIFEDNLRTYLVLSNLIQLTFVVLDLSVANVIGKVGVLSIIQIFNYAFAGVLLFATLCVFSTSFSARKVYEMRGAYFCSPPNAICGVIAALSLAGIPTLNIFVAEWYLFIASYEINPAITAFGIFAALILFIMYFKVAYVLLTGVAKIQKMKVPIALTALNCIFAAICVILGLFPQFQHFVLEGFL